MRLPRCAAALIALALTLSAGSADAAGRRVINNYPVATVNNVTRVPVAVATSDIVFPIIKLLPQARVANALANAMVYGGAAAVIGQLMLDEYNADNGSNITYNSTTNVFENSTHTFVWGFSGPCNANLSPMSAGASVAYVQACMAAYSNAYWYTIWNSFSCIDTDAYGCRAYRAQLSFSNGGDWAYEWSRQAGVYSSASSDTVSDQELAEAVSQYSQPYNQRDFWEPYPGASDVQIQNFDGAAHEPLRLSDSQIADLNSQLSGTCNAAGELLIYELCLMGKDHGVTASPPSTDVPEATQTEGATAGNVTVNVPADTPGGAFAPTQLETLDSFQAITQSFQAAIAAAPIVTAWTGITATIPSATCPQAEFTWNGNTYNLATTACAMWESTAAPLLSLVFLFVWPFIGLRLIFSA